MRKRELRPPRAALRRKWWRQRAAEAPERGNYKTASSVRDSTAWMSYNATDGLLEMRCPLAGSHIGKPHAGTETGRTKMQVNDTTDALNAAEQPHRLVARRSLLFTPSSICLWNGYRVALTFGLYKC